jgi:ubiquinone/menaquinone biosynthesis C-methylase UbiE
MYHTWKNKDPWMTDVVIPILAQYFSNSSYTILDVGCGQGILYDRLPDNIRKQYTGFDFSQSMLSVFNKNHPNVKTMNLDIINNGLCDNYSDISVCFNTLMYFTDELYTAITEIYRITKKIILFSIPLSKAEPFCYPDGNPIFNYDDFFEKINTIIQHDSIEIINLNYHSYHLVHIHKTEK